MSFAGREMRLRVKSAAATNLVAAAKRTVECSHLTANLCALASSAEQMDREYPIMTLLGPLAEGSQQLHSRGTCSCESPRNALRCNALHKEFRTWWKRPNE